MKTRNIKLLSVAATLLFTGLTFLQGHVAFAAEGGTQAVGKVVLPTIRKEIISVILPTVSEESPFDFIIDPQGLIYETGAAQYGGGVVEENAHLLFRNRSDAGYDFTRNSDRLTVINRSTVPVMVTINARMDDVTGVRLTDDPDTEQVGEPAFYLALTDDEGNEEPLTGDGEVSVSVEMKEAPANAYFYRYDEASGGYEYTESGEDIEFDTYSFGLHGECNSSAEWSDVSISPKIIVVWKVEPVSADETEDTENVQTDTDDKENMSVITGTENPDILDVDSGGMTR